MRESCPRPRAPAPHSQVCDVEGRKNAAASLTCVDLHCHYLNPDVAAKVAPLNPGAVRAEVQFANALTREINVKQMQERGPKLSTSRSA